MLVSYQRLANPDPSTRYELAIPSTHACWCDAISTIFLSEDSGSSGRQVPAQVDVFSSLCRAVRFNDSPTRLLTTVLLIIAQPRSPPPP